MSQPANIYVTTLAQTLASGGAESEVYVSSITTLDGQTITTADFAEWGRGVLTIDPQSSSRAEFISFTAVDGVGIGFTGITRGLSFKDNTSIPANKKFHPVGATVLISFGTHNIQDMVDKFADVGSAETISGLWNFTTSPTVPTPTTATQAVNKSYTDGIAIAGGADATSAVKGISKLTVTSSRNLGNPTISIATPAVITLANHGLIAGDTIQLTTTGALPTGLTVSTQYYVIAAGLTANAFEVSTTSGGAAINTSGTQSGVHTLLRTTPFAVGADDPKFIQYFEDTGAANAYVITPSPAVSTYVDGQIYHFRAANANTTTSTLNVNGLGAKVIYKGNGTTALASGDIAAGMNVMVIYENVTDSFRMLNPVANAPTIAPVTRFGGTGADGALSITSGTTTINLGGAAIVVKNYTSISITGTGQLAFSNPHANGTIIILKSQGGVTLTSSTVPNINGAGMGASGAATTVAGNVGATGSQPNSNVINPSDMAGSGGGLPAAGANGVAGNAKPLIVSTTVISKTGIPLIVGAGGGAGGGSLTGGGGTQTGGAGGNGGGGLYIECAGALNFTTASGISVAGANGATGTPTGTPNTGGAGGGAGGGGGFVVIIYNTLTANSGTINVSGGTGAIGQTSSAGGFAGGGAGGASQINNGTAGTGGSVNTGGTGGNGGAGWSLVVSNTEFI